MGGLSRDSLFDQRIGVSLGVQGGYGGVDGAIRSLGVGKGLVGQMMRVEIVPDNLDVVELGCVFGPLDPQVSAKTGSHARFVSRVGESCLGRVSPALRSSLHMSLATTTYSHREAQPGQTL